jgi:uncharacterized Zn finger protein
MADFPPLAIPDIQRWVGEQSLARGRPYFQQGAISSPRRQGLTLKAQCQGSRSAPYHVEVTLGASGIVSGACSCPVGGGGHCKHVAALLLAWLETPEDFVEVEDVTTALERLDKAELVALVRRMVRRSPDLEQLLELELPARRETSAAQPVDTSSIRRQMRHAFDLARSRWGSTAAVSRDARQFLEQAEVYLERDDGTSAAAIYAEIARCVLDHYSSLAEGDEGYDEDYDERGYYGHRYDEYDEYDEAADRFDEDGELGVIVDECVEGLRRCLMVVSAPTARESILEALFDIYQWNITHEDFATGSDVSSVIIEQATLEERAHVANLVRDVLPGGQGWDAEYRRKRYAPFLLELEGDTIDDETYLRICRETGLLHELVERLLALGRVAEAAAAARQSEDMRLLGLADLFISHNQGALIEQVVRERARASQMPALIEWLKKRAKEAGNSQEALSLTETEFWRFPSVPSYNELKDLAQPLGQWDALRASILERLTKEKQYAVLTQIHLAEGAVDRALESLELMKKVHGYWYGGGTLAIQVARAAEESRPEAAIQLYLQQVEELIQHQGRENYAIAAGHLKRVRDLYRQQGAGGTWQALITDLREKQRRLRALQDELNKAGLFAPEPRAQPETPGPSAAEKPASPTVHLLRSPSALHDQ